MSITVKPVVNPPTLPFPTVLSLTSVLPHGQLFHQSPSSGFGSRTSRLVETAITTPSTVTFCPMYCAACASLTTTGVSAHDGDASGAGKKRTEISSRRKVFMKSSVGVLSEHYEYLAEERRADRSPRPATVSANPTGTWWRPGVSGMMAPCFGRLLSLHWLRRHLPAQRWRCCLMQPQAFRLRSSSSSKCCKAVRRQASSQKRRATDCKRTI
jgi:hypothetical protein